jgi:hypothetical protein
MIVSFSLKPILTEWLKRYEPDVKEVIGYEDDTEAGGYCETCYYEEAIVNIYYLDSKGAQHKYVYSGEFAELISSLENANG